MFSNLLVINLGVKLLGRMFDVSRNCQTVVQSSCIVLHSYEQCMKVPIFLPPHDFFFNYSQSSGMKWYLTVFKV